jgi:hypothetical protein
MQSASHACWIVYGRKAEPEPTDCECLHARPTDMHAHHPLSNGHQPLPRPHLAQIQPAAHIATVRQYCTAPHLYDTPSIDSVHCQRLQKELLTDRAGSKGAWCCRAGPSCGTLADKRIYVVYTGTSCQGVPICWMATGRIPQWLPLQHMQSVNSARRSSGHSRVLRSPYCYDHAPALAPIT